MLTVLSDWRILLLLLLKDGGWRYCHSATRLRSTVLATNKSEFAQLYNLPAETVRL